jgi:hypothetical protein
VRNEAAFVVMVITLKPVSVSVCPPPGLGMARQPSRPGRAVTQVRPESSESFEFRMRTVTRTRMGGAATGTTDPDPADGPGPGLGRQPVGWYSTA